MDLTWDETDKDRVTMTMRKFTKDDLEKMDFNDYLAGSSDEEEDGGQYQRPGIHNCCILANLILRYLGRMRMKFIIHTTLKDTLLCDSHAEPLLSYNVLP